MGRFGVILWSFWPHFGVFFGSFFAHFWDSFTVILWFFGDVLGSWLQNWAKRCKRRKKCGKRCRQNTKFLPKFTKIMQKHAPFSPIKHLFCLKPDQKLTFQPMNVCRMWACVDVSCQWILSVFMNFYEDLDGFWTDFIFRHYRHFWPFLDHFWPFLGPKWMIFGSLWGHFRVTYGWFCIVLGSFWGYFDIVLASFFGRFFFCAFLTILGPFKAKKGGHFFGWFGSKVCVRSWTLFWRGYIELSIGERIRPIGHE